MGAAVILVFLGFGVAALLVASAAGLLFWAVPKGPHQPARFIRALAYWVAAIGLAAFVDVVVVSVGFVLSVAYHR